MLRTDVSREAPDVVRVLHAANGSVVLRRAISAVDKLIGRPHAVRIRFNKKSSSDLTCCSPNGERWPSLLASSFVSKYLIFIFVKVLLSACRRSFQLIRPAEC